jgi:hypothetical protein
MENAKSVQKKSTKKFLKIFQNHSSKKAVSPQEEWFPSFIASDNSHHVSSSHSTSKNRYSNDDVFQGHQHYQQQQQSLTRSNSVQRRFSFSNVHESGRQRLLAAKRAEYQEKMTAFDDLIQRRRGSTLRLALAPDVTSH